MLRLASRRGNIVAALRSDRRGVSAVEFALILPIMLALWAGMAEMAHAIDNWRKVTQLARTVADLTSQGDPNSNPMAAATMTDILAASSAVLRPFDGSKAKIVVSALEVNLVTSPANPKVCSSVSTGNNVYARTTGVATDLGIPPGLLKDGQRYILAEVTMPYAPMIGGSLVKLVRGMNSSIVLKSSFPWPTRGGASYNSKYSEVILPGGNQCP